MHYRTMKSSGDQLSILGYGCMRLPERNGKIDEDRAKKQLFSAIERGVNYFDTAMPYHMGASEPFLGRALRDGYRHKVKLATKMPHWNVHAHEDMERFLSAQLKNLQTDHIDYYLIHSLQGVAWAKLKNLGVDRFIQTAMRDGRIRNIGFSFHGGKEDFRSIVDDYPWGFCQLQINYLDGENQAGLEGMRYAASKGLGIIAMEPLRGGALGGLSSPKVKEIWAEAPRPRSPAEWALRWVWNLPEVTLALSGMNEEAHIAENLRIAEEALPESLSAAELDIVERASAAFRKSLAIACTGCRYCMPCPSGIRIPSVFQFYNDSFFDSKRSVITPRIRYFVEAGGVMAGDAPGLASQCAECNTCVKACPQHLEIPSLLKAVARKFEGPALPLVIFALRIYFRFDGWRARRKAG